jgi:DNA-binding GntR family transcriptional regulator
MHKINELGSMKLAEGVFLELRDRIVSLEYPPETVLSEKDLGKEFGVSRTPLREAIYRLHELGLVRSIPRYGTCVTHIDMNEIRNSYEVRRTLENLAGYLAAKRITTEQLDQLKGLVDSFRKGIKNGVLKELTYVDMRFHETIYNATDNPILQKFLMSLNSRCLRFFNAGKREYMYNAEVLRQLESIYSALEEANAEKAGRCCEEHVQYFLDGIRSSLF